MVNSVFHLDAFSLREPVSISLENAPGNTRAGSRPHVIGANASRAASFPEKCDLFSGNFGQFSRPMIRRWNSWQPQASPIREPRAKL
jgi:hypothetical protein